MVGVLSALSARRLVEPLKQNNVKDVVLHSDQYPEAPIGAWVKLHELLPEL